MKVLARGLISTLKCPAWIFIAIALGAAFQPAMATTAYARRETKSCGFCHESGSPGFVEPVTNVAQPVTLNERGKYYVTHGHTFAGYVEPLVPRKIVTPKFRFVWQEELMDSPRRIAVADVKGDGFPRLITLNEQPGRKDRSTLTIKRWIENAKGFANEFSVDIASSPSYLAVGRFAGNDQPVVIMTESDIWFWDGKAYARKSLPQPLTLLGVSRIKSGLERVLIVAKGATALAYRVNLKGSGAGLIVDGVETPSGKSVLSADMHGEPKMLDSLGLPTELSSGGMFGLWAAGKSGALYLYYPKNEQDFDVVNNPENKNAPKVIYKGRPFSHVLLRDPTDAAGAEIWASPALKGTTYDIALADVKTAGSDGILVLSSLSKSGDGRTLYFFGQN